MCLALKPSNLSPYYILLHLRGVLLTAGYFTFSKILTKLSSLLFSILCCYNSETLSVSLPLPPRLDRGLVWFSRPCIGGSLKSLIYSQNLACYLSPCYRYWGRWFNSKRHTQLNWPFCSAVYSDYTAIGTEHWVLCAGGRWRRLQEGSQVRPEISPTLLYTADRVSQKPSTIILTSYRWCSSALRVWMN